MANYGKIFVPLGILLLIPGFIFMSMYGGDISSIVFLSLGFLLLFVGLPRLVQGKDRKIMGQIIRPKAAARSSSIYALFAFMLCPFYLPGSAIINYTPPFPINIWASGLWANPSFSYGWIPGVIIGFIVIFLLGIILSSKIPKTIHVIFNLIIMTCIYFHLNFGIQLFLWSFFEDQSNLWLFSNSPLNDFAFQIGISIGYLIMSIYLIMRMIKKTGEAYETLYVDGSKKVLLFITIISSYIICSLPLYFAYQMSVENNAYTTPYINYVGFVFIIIIIIKIFTTILKTIRRFSRERQGKVDSMEATKFGFSTALYLVIFFFAWAPIFLPLVDSGQNTKHNSIYNTDWNGWSNFKNVLEEQEGYTVMSIQSSISVIESLPEEKHIIFVAAGPNVFYNPASEIPFFLTAFKRNFSMFINEDQGTAENLLFQTFIASMGKTPITFIPKGTLRDNASYWRTPAFPVIRDFSPSPLTNNVDKVVLSYASGFLGGEILDGLGWEIIGRTSGQFSFIDIDNDGVYDQTKDVYKFPKAITNILSEQEGGLGLTGDLLSLGFPLGGYAQGVFSIKEVSETSRIFCATDASWLNNELTSIADFDNLQFGLNVMNWLAMGHDRSNTIIVFDEAHIRAESGIRDISSAGTFGLLQGYVNWISTNPILGLVYPLFALNTLRKWLPKEGDKEKVQLKDLEEAERNAALLRFRTSSFFAQKINWYRKNKKYRLALVQLYRRLERKVNRMLGSVGKRDADVIMTAIRRERGTSITNDNYKRIERFFKNMLAFKENKEDIQTEEKFEEMFMEMRWVNDILSFR